MKLQIFHGTCCLLKVHFTNFLDKKPTFGKSKKNFHEKVTFYFTKILSLDSSLKVSICIFSDEKYYLYKYFVFEISCQN